MELHFHGATYNQDPSTLEVVETSTGGLYRGSPWKLHQFTKQYRRRPKAVTLTYRGVTYQA